MNKTVKVDMLNQYDYVSQVNKNTHVTLKCCFSVVGQGLRRERNHVAHHKHRSLALLKFPLLKSWN